MQASPINHMVLGKVECKEDRQCLGFGDEGDPSPTLAPTHMHAAAIAFEPGIVKREGRDNRFVEEATPTLRANAGDNQVSAAIGVDAYKQTCEEAIGHTLRNPSGGDNTAKVAMSYDGYNQSGAEETCHTLRVTSGGESTDSTAKVAIGINNQGGATPQATEESAGTIMAATNSSGNNLQGVAVQNATQYIVRRLTPKECERLMGYPDDYTVPMFKDITDELVDAFVKIHNDFNALMSDKPVKPKTHKQVRKWLETISKKETCSDAPRYKVCGNGWAINCARWVLQGVDRYLRNLDS